MILFTAGDVGGARAILPVIQECHSRRLSFIVLKHGPLSQECPSSWPKILPPDKLTAATTADWLAELKISTLVFGSSVSDTLPLTLARQSHEHGLPVMHVLDNWSNYRRRLEHDGLPMLIPDIYTVMDEIAYDGTVSEGLPSECIKITGQPALAPLADEYTSLNNNYIGKDSLRLLFVSEPVESDQGTGPESPTFRGYTEKTVLNILCQALQPFAHQIKLSVLPHPREKQDELAETWQAAKGGLCGGVLTKQNSRRNVLEADGVIGMASILLYEAWLIGKPVLSLQPDLRTQALRMLEKRANLNFVDQKEEIACEVDAWLQSIRQGNKSPHPDLFRHQGAAIKICDLLEDLLLPLVKKP